MNDNHVLDIVTSDHFDPALASEPGLVLLACIRPRFGHSRQLKVIEKFSKKNIGRLKIFLAARESIRTFGERYGCRGEPFFVLFENGALLGRFLGCADQDMMEAFLSKCLTAHREKAT